MWIINVESTHEIDYITVTQITVCVCPDNTLHWETKEVVLCNVLFLCIDGDSNDKLTAMWSRSVARSQRWTTVSKGTGWLCAPDFNSTGNNQLWKKACFGIPTRVHLHLPGLTLNQYITWLAGGGTVKIWCTKRSGPFWYAMFCCDSANPLFTVFCCNHWTKC